MKKKVLFLLSGAGVFDGSEIHEATLLLLCLSQKDIEVQAVAPNILQKTVVDHIAQTTRANEARNVLSESARIARGAVQSLDQLLEKNFLSFDGLVIPGGLGVVTTLSDYATTKDNMHIQPSVEKVISSFLQRKAPILATCIAPVLIASVASKLKLSVTLTLGMLDGDRTWLIKQGMNGVQASSHKAIFDQDNAVITTPAYMNSGATISDIWIGIEEAVNILYRSLHDR